MSLTQEIRRLWESLEGRGVLGQRVDRAGADMGATAARVAIFNVLVGEILVTALYGTMTGAGGAGANNVSFDSTPAAGKIGVMNSATGDINGAIVGDMCAARGDLLLPSVEAALGCGIPTMHYRFICQVGTIGFSKDGAVDAGEWEFSIFFIPLTDGAYVTAT